MNAPQTQCAQTTEVTESDGPEGLHEVTRVARRVRIDTRLKTMRSVLGSLTPSSYHWITAWRVFRTDRLAPVFSIWEPALVVDGMPL